MFCAATTQVNVKIFSPLRHWQFYDTRTLKQLDENLRPMHEEARCSFFLFFHSLLSTACFFFLFFSKTQIFFLFLPHKFSALSLSEIIMGDNVKEFTNEERSLLKFQKKQQHGQVLLLLLVVVLVHSYSCGSVVLFLFVVYCV